MWDAILNDKWMWMVVWGKQRTGKTTIQMQLAHAVYKDWDMVLNSFVFNLSGLLYKIDRGQPTRIFTKNLLHNRIPLIIYDDWGGSSNKAQTQYDKAWDIFKGGFDVLGTDMSILIASMVDPSEPTFQLQQKYTHEIFVPERGVYKYDTVNWYQDYRGWQPKRKKDWIETQFFFNVPRDVYKQYDEMRMSLVDEVKQRIRDAIAETQIEHILNRISPIDIKLLELIQAKGLVYMELIKNDIGPDAKEVVTRCKARNLVVSVRVREDKTKYYKYDLTDLGIQVLDAINKRTTPALSLVNRTADLLNAKPQVSTPLQKIAFKKQVAESLKFQGLRVTESYEDNEPDLVVWKDGTTPSEIISIKSLTVLPIEVNVESECSKEIVFAQKYGFKKLRLICFDALQGEKIFDEIVEFWDKVTVGKQEAKQQINTPVSEIKPIQPTGKVNRLVFDKKFQTSPIEISDRVVAVSDAFGIGVDQERIFTIFDNLELKYDDGDFMYITGDSGSGKSTFLKIFHKHELERGRKCVNFDDIQPSSDEVLINSIGENQLDAMRILGVVGLSEAFLMVRRYKELSDGQKYRYRLGKAIDQDADTFLVDEFGAKLDREMAKTLAFCIQKWARKNKKTVVIATTHRDLMEDFNADIIFDRRFGEQTKPAYYQPRSPPKFSLVQDMKIEQATQEDYNQLKQFHYLHGKPPTSHKFKLTNHGRTIGIILYGPSFLASSYRNQLFPEYKNNAKKVNEDILRITRVIVHPKYRGVGLAQELIRLTLPMVNKRIVETIAAMAQYNPFFEKAGMKLVGKQKFLPTQETLIKFVETQDANIGLLQDHSFRKDFLNKLSSAQMTQLISILEKIVKGMKGVSTGRWKALDEELQSGNIEKVMSKVLPVERAYLYWLNPQVQT